MGIKSGNDWTPSGDYGTPLQEELKRRADILDTAIDSINKQKKKLLEENKNSEITDAIEEILVEVIKRLEANNTELKLKSTQIKKYHG